MQPARAHTRTESREGSVQEAQVPLSAIEILDSLLAEALRRGVSDIHLTPGRDGFRVRMRIDGLLEDIQTYPLSSQAAVLARIKILAGLRTDEHFSAQDGRFSFRDAHGMESDVRVSIAPTYFGENAVLRLLSSRQGSETLQALGCRSAHQMMLARALRQPHGMILATGPTGSGKTTLLYALLQMLDSTTRSIVTLEDPVEYSLPGISQIPVSAERGLTFANGLRSVLRQDPDVIMVGEIRDTETAKLAMNASLTGHLVLSTLHTNDAVSTLPRLMDMGIEPYLIASTIQMIVAQRLVRRICKDCRTESVPKERHVEQLRKAVPERISGTETFFSGAGCSGCNGTGYRGRVGIYEILLVDEGIRGSILEQKSIDDLRALAADRGMLSLSGDGLEKVRKGITTMEELSRISYA